MAIGVFCKLVSRLVAVTTISCSALGSTAVAVAFVSAAVGAESATAVGAAALAVVPCAKAGDAAEHSKDASSHKRALPLVLGELEKAPATASVAPRSTWIIIIPLSSGPIADSRPN